MVMVCSIWQEMSMSGVGTFTILVLTCREGVTPTDRRMGLYVYYAAVRGTHAPSTRGVPLAPTTLTMILVWIMAFGVREIFSFLRF